MKIRINYKMLIEDAKRGAHREESALARKVFQRAIDLICDDEKDPRRIAEAWLGTYRLWRMTPDEVLKEAAREVIKDASIDEVLPYLEVADEGRSENGQYQGN